jgi:MoxR-like ATPase
MSLALLNNKKYEKILRHYNVNFETALFTIIEVGFITNQHVILTTDLIPEVSKYIQLVSSSVFGISRPEICTCRANTEWSDIGDAFHNTNVLILTDFDRTCREVQADLLEGLMKGVFTFPEKYQSTERVVRLPEDFHVFLVNRQNSKEKNDLLCYLKDYFFFQYSFTVEDESDFFMKIRDLENLPRESITTLITKNDLQSYRTMLSQVKIIPDLKVYMQNIIIFLRTHRVIRKGVSPRTVKSFDLLVRVLCVLNSSSFATPTLISLAARTLFPLKIELVTVQDEPSLHYGSDINLLKKWLPKWNAEMVIEDVLTAVPSPL